MAQRRREDGTGSEAAREIHTRISLNIIAKHNFPGADAIGGDAGIRLQPHSEIGSSTAGAGTADNFIPLSEGDCSSRSAGEGLGAFSDHADRRLEIDFCRVDFRVRAAGWSAG